VLFVGVSSLRELADLTGAERAAAIRCTCNVPAKGAEARTTTPAPACKHVLAVLPLLERGQGGATSAPEGRGYGRRA
jgi:hypothetical protein